MVESSRQPDGQPSAASSALPKIDTTTDLHAHPNRHGLPDSQFEAVEACPCCSPEKFFESIYECAEGDPTRVPWAECRPNPCLVEWMNREACQLVRPGARAVVIGCGLGDDLLELIRRGYDAVGIDVSPTAIRWAARRHSQHAERFIAADLMNLPARLVGRFDLAVEISTIQSVHPSLRRLIVGGIARTLTPRGTVMVLTRARDEADEMDMHDGPPWPLTRGELIDLFSAAGLCPHGELRQVPDPRPSSDDTEPRAWLMGTFVRCG